MKHIQDLGEFLEDSAGDDPVCVQCPKCDGRGSYWNIYIQRKTICPRCAGRGICRNPDLEP